MKDHRRLVPYKERERGVGRENKKSNAIKEQATIPANRSFFDVGTARHSSEIMIGGFKELFQVIGLSEPPCIKGSNV